MIAPSVEYGVLYPILIVFGVAVSGVLTEAFAPRQARYPVQLALSLGGLLAAFVGVVGVYRGLGAGRGQAAAVGAVIVDRPALFLQGTILLVAVLGVMLIAQRGSRSADAGLDAFTPQASAVPGSLAEQVATDHVRRRRDDALRRRR
jgi:NADH-quinone oxidoreductase subunit N